MHRRPFLSGSESLGGSGRIGVFSDGDFSHRMQALAPPGIDQLRTTVHTTALANVLRTDLEKAITFACVPACYCMCHPPACLFASLAGWYFFLLLAYLSAFLSACLKICCLYAPLPCLVACLRVCLAVAGLRG